MSRADLPARLQISTLLCPSLFTLWQDWLGFSPPSPPHLEQQTAKCKLKKPAALDCALASHINKQFYGTSL